MKVLHVTPISIPNIGGITIYVQNITFHLANLGYDITIISPIRINKKIDTKDYDRIVRIPSVYLSGWPFPLRNVGIPLDMGKKIDRLVKEGNFDLVHVHGHHFPITWIAIRSAHKYNIPCILTVLGTYGLNPLSISGKIGIEKFFNRFFFSRILTKITGVIGLTKYVTNHAKNHGPPSLRYFTIPPGVNKKLFEENLGDKDIYRQKYNIHPNSIVILFCGRFEHVKGIIEFAKAVKLLLTNVDNVEVIIVGGGPLEKKVYSILNGISHIHLLKWQPHEKLHEIYIISDIFVISSRFEGLPIALLEAMAASLHIVYTSVGGIPDALENYVSKTMITRISISEIYEVLLSVVSYFNKRGNYDYANTHNLSDWKDIAINIANAYRQIIK